MFKNITRTILNRKADLTQKFYENNILTQVLEEFLNDKFNGKILIDDLDYKLQNKELIIKTKYGIISQELICYKEELKKRLNYQGLNAQRILIF